MKEIIVPATIKTLIDLVTNLHDRVKDRKFASEISQIQSLIFAVQKENAAVISENLDLKKAHANEISEIRKSHAKETSDLNDGCEKTTSELKKELSELKTENASLVEQNNNMIIKSGREANEKARKRAKGYSVQ